jgi:hypothetical protein
MRKTYIVSDYCLMPNKPFSAISRPEPVACPEQVNFDKMMMSALY